MSIGMEYPNCCLVTLRSTAFLMILPLIRHPETLSCQSEIHDIFLIQSIGPFVARFDV